MPGPREASERGSRTESGRRDARRDGEGRGDAWGRASWSWKMRRNSPISSFAACARAREAPSPVPMPVAASAAAPATNRRRLKVPDVSDIVLSHPQAQPRIDGADLPLVLRRLRWLMTFPLRVLLFRGFLDQVSHTLVSLWCARQ